MAGTLYITRGYRNDSTTLADINHRLEAGFRKIHLPVQDFGSDAAEVVERLLLPEHLERSFFLSLPATTGPRSSCAWIANGRCPSHVRSIANCPLRSCACQTLFLRPKATAELAGLFPAGESLCLRCQIQGCPCAPNGAVLDIQDVLWYPEMPKQTWEQEVSVQIRFTNPPLQQSGNVLTQALITRFPVQASQVKSLLDQWVLSLADSASQFGAQGSRQEAAFAALLQQSPSIAPRLGEYLFDIRRARLPQQRTAISRFFNSALNGRQQAAVQIQLDAPEISLLQGSMVENTQVLGELVQQLVSQQKRVLIVSSTPQAVSQILEALPKDAAIQPIHASSDPALAYTSTRAAGTYGQALAQQAQQKLAEQELQNPRRRQLAAALEDLADFQVRWEETNEALQALETDIQTAVVQLEKLRRTPASEFAPEAAVPMENPQYRILEQHLETLNAAMRTADDQTYSQLEQQRRELLHQMDACMSSDDTAGERQKEAACQEQQRRLELLRGQQASLQAKWEEQEQTRLANLQAFHARFFADQEFQENHLLAIARRELATPETLHWESGSAPAWVRWNQMLGSSDAGERDQAALEYQQTCNVVGMATTDDLEVLQSLPNVSSAFDVVILCDVCQMPIRELLIPLQLAPKAILMGDSSQTEHTGWQFSFGRTPHWFVQLCNLAAPELKSKL